jgi:hypothetical protein
MPLNAADRISRRISGTSAGQWNRRRRKLCGIRHTNKKGDCRLTIRIPIIGRCIYHPQ